MVFAFDGNPAFRIEDDKPYALAGANGGDYFPAPLTEGTHVVIATPFSANGGQGNAGASLTLDFTVCSQWTTVFRHGSTGGDYFANDAEALSVDVSADPATVKKFSRLSELESARGADGKFHFKLVYPKGLIGGAPYKELGKSVREGSEAPRLLQQ